MIKRLLSWRRAPPAFYPGEDIQEPGRLRYDATSRQSIETGRTRLIVTGALFMAAFGVVAVRMVDVTVLKGGEDNRQPRSARALELKMGRADIVDRNGVVLATSLPTVSVYANPTEIIDAEAAAAKLVGALPELAYADVLARLRMERSFVYLRRNLTPRQQHAVNALGIPGLYFENSERRVYPHGHAASHVVGLADLDNRGISGVEKTFDARLSAHTDPLRLSIDLRVQGILRTELAHAVTTFRAAGATGMVIDVRTGEMIAMVSLPDFDPNAPANTTSEVMFNRATLGVYEMGSTFKLFNTAVALDSGAASIRDGYDASQPIRIARFTITDYHGQNRWLSVPEILVHSSNIGSAKMALDFGTEVQKAYLGKFGLLRSAAIELPEIGAPLVPSPWREINTMTISYGHGLAVTPLQMAVGVSALVNGGIYRTATLIRRDVPGEVAGQRVVKAETSRQMRELMRMVVTEGTGGKADVAGYNVGGKTGTAEKLGAGGGYRRKSLLSSFIATFPVDDPRYVVLAMIDEPQGTKETYGYATGGWTAAPVVGRTIAQIGPMLGVAPRLPAAPEEPGAFRQAALKGSKLASSE